MVTKATKSQKRARESPRPAASPATVRNWIGGAECDAELGECFEKLNPHDGEVLWPVARSREPDVARAVAAARASFRGWASTPPVKRGEILDRVADALRGARQDMARMVALEAGKSPASALGETDGAVLLGEFFAGEGQRLYGRTSTSATPNRYASSVRQPLGVAGLIVPANTPIANVAWKTFPALICGNTVVLKAAEDSPHVASLFARLAHDAGLPAGVLNVIHGYGAEAGAPLVAHPDVAVVSFTGSTAAGREIAAVAGKRLVPVSLELGGKNPFVVCDDADLENAVKWALLSAFSNAGQRCASGSRIIVFERVADRFRDLLVERTAKLKVGPGDSDDLGPVINARALERMLAAVSGAVKRGARLLVGGGRITDEAHRRGFYLQPTVLEGVSPDDPISTDEVFGPVTCLYRMKDFESALALANRSPYGLTACIHTASVHRATEFTQRVEAGVAVVNGGTFGSEPHMPFGGVKASGNGTREPGTEALNVYSALKNIIVQADPSKV